MGLKDLKNSQLPAQNPESTSPQHAQQVAERIGPYILEDIVEVNIAPQTQEEIRAHNQKAMEKVARGERLRPNEYRTGLPQWRD